MANDVSFMQYMRAHGNSPGPTDHPYLTGAITGLCSGIIASAVLHLSGTSDGIAGSFGISAFAITASSLAEMVIAGVIYAFIFKRAANDRRGGWLFGISYGFLLWMFAPVLLWQLITGRPVVVGMDAAVLFAAELLYGALLGRGFPHIHRMLQQRFTGEAAAPAETERDPSSRPNPKRQAKPAVARGE